VLHILMFAWALALIASGALGSRPALAQTETDLKALNRHVTELYQAGKYGEAIPLAERYAEATEALHGPDRPEYATAVAWLAQLLQATNRLAEAEPLMRRALAITRRASGRSIPTLPLRLTTWHSCCRPPTGWARRSR
jgi:tetratricopeptide (TPR) repeat protein